MSILGQRFLSVKTISLVGDRHRVCPRNYMTTLFEFDKFVSDFTLTASRDMENGY